MKSLQQFYTMSQFSFNNFDAFNFNIVCTRFYVYLMERRMRSGLIENAFMQYAVDFASVVLPGITWHGIAFS